MLPRRWEKFAAELGSCLAAAQEPAGGGQRPPAPSPGQVLPPTAPRFPFPASSSQRGPQKLKPVLLHPRALHPWALPPVVPGHGDGYPREFILGGWGAGSASLSLGSRGVSGVRRSCPVHGVKRGKRGAPVAPGGSEGDREVAVGVCNFCEPAAPGTRCHPAFGRSHHWRLPSGSAYCPDFFHT